MDLADTHAYAHTEIDLAALHFSGRPDVRLGHAHQRKDVAGLAHLAGAIAAEMAGNRYRRALRVVDGFDIAGHRRNKASLAAAAQLGTLRAAQRIGEDFDLAMISQVVDLHDAATPDHITAAVLLRRLRDLCRRNDDVGRGGLVDRCR